MITVEFVGGPRDGTTLGFEDDTGFRRGIVLAPVNEDDVPEDGDLPKGTEIHVWQSPDGSQGSPGGRLRVEYVGTRVFNGVPVERAT